MIDLHSHILPGVDDGAKDLSQALAMARMAQDDGTEVIAATPHFMPGLYDNQATDIRQRVEELNEAIAAEGLHVAVVTGSDAHIRPDFVTRLKAGEILTLHDTRYVLFEPPHMTMPPRMEDMLFNIMASGYVPILTHPERLTWIEQHYTVVERLSEVGVWMQITAGSLTGRFGKRPQYWAQRMMAEGRVHILASDGHNTTSRPPTMSSAFDIACGELGLDEATHLVVTRPTCILENAKPETSPPIQIVPPAKPGNFLRRLFSGKRV